MKLKNIENNLRDICIPDGSAVAHAMDRTTHLGIGAHQDDLEIMAFDGIWQCFATNSDWFTGVTVTDGAGSPRAGKYEHCSDEDMKEVRKQEQEKAASTGEYSAVIQLDYASSEVKDPTNRDVVSDIFEICSAAKPSVVYTHNPADKHDTHVSVMFRTVEALRQLPAEERPDKLYGCEVWRNLDWMLDEDKIAFDVSEGESLAPALLGIFQSQVSGGKRYDLATVGRWRANATYFASHGVDDAALLIYAMDLTPLIQNDNLSVGEYVHGFADRVGKEITDRFERVGTK